jgi:rhamnogalacturonyl hydrolase YesR
MMTGKFWMATILLALFATGLVAQQPVTFTTPTAVGDTPATAGPKAQHLSAKFYRRDVAKALTLVADWQLQRLPVSPKSGWTFAALYDGLLAVPNAVKGDKYQQAVTQIAEQLEWKPGLRVLNADDHAIGKAYLELYLLHRDEQRIAPIRARMDEVMATPEDPKKLLWWWSDALYMAPPVLAELYGETGDAKYISFMDAQWSKTSDLLYDQKQHLFSRDATFLDKHEKNGEKVYWSRGNGWVMGGLVRVLQRLPADSTLRAKYVLQLQQMAEATAAIQSKDGLWRPGLLDPDSYALPEISGSAFITYAIAYGVNEKILDKKKYTPVVQKAWAGMLAHIYADGRLGCIQPIGAAPGVFTETSSYVFGVGAYLLAGSEIYRMAK